MDPQRVALERDRSQDQPAPGLTPHEKYLFDLRGYLVVKNALTPAQLQDARCRLALRLEARRAAAASADHKLVPLRDTHFGSDRTGNALYEGEGATPPSLSLSLSLSRARLPRPGCPGAGQNAWSAASLIEWGGTFVELIDLPTIAPKLRSLFGDAPYRMDHECARRYLPATGISIGAKRIDRGRRRSSGRASF